MIDSPAGGGRRVFVGGGRRYRWATMKCSPTVCLVSSLSAGPWIYWHDLDAACTDAAQLGFDGIELFTESPDQIAPDRLRGLLDTHGLELAAVGTGAGKVFHGLSLTDADPDVRQRAREFIVSMVEFGAPFGAPAIIGSMQGSRAPGDDPDEVLGRLRDGLAACGARAAELGVPLIYEPLNRYESNLINRLDDAAGFVRGLETASVRLLADLFHMNIEEADLAETIRRNGDVIGHVHFADSNRRPMGSGHTDVVAVGRALRDVGYDRFLSAEAFPHPDPHEAAVQTLASFRHMREASA